MDPLDWTYDGVLIYVGDDDMDTFATEPGRAGLLRELLHVDELADEDVEDLFDDYLDALPDEEAFNLGKAFQQFQRTMADPRVAAIVKTALPLAGTMIGGPAVGLAAGSLAGAALGGAAKPAAPAPGGAVIAQAQAPAATRALATLQQPVVMPNLLSAALRAGGMPTQVPATQTAPNPRAAQQPLRAGGRRGRPWADAQSWSDPASGAFGDTTDWSADDALYDTLIGAPAGDPGWG